MCVDRMTLLDAALANSRKSLGTVNPQYSYYDRLVQQARVDDAVFVRVYSHVLHARGLEGL